MAQGVTYGEYYLIGRLASGGRAEVFLARSSRAEHAGRLLALKRTLSEPANTSASTAVFGEPGRIAGGLDHPNICRVFDVGRLVDQHYMAMEFIHGKDLAVLAHRAKQREETIPHAYAAYICARVADGLHAAHCVGGGAGGSQGVVHRDVGPQNILVSYDGQPKLVDFGMNPATDRIGRSQTGKDTGKIAYMSPEQAVGGVVDARSDVFSLGAVLYQLLTGRSPFQGTDDFSILKQIASAEFEPPAGAFPPRLVRSIERCLAKKPDDRYSTAQELAADLERFLDDEGRSVDAGTISSYMRKLFRDDYIRETARIKGYLEMKLPEKPAAEPVADSAAEAFVPEEATREVEIDPKFLEQVLGGIKDNIEGKQDETNLGSSVDLAAGFEPEKPAEALEPLPPQDDDFVGLVTAEAELIEELPISGEFDEPTVNMSADQFVFSEHTHETPFKNSAEFKMPEPASAAQQPAEPTAPKASAQATDATVELDVNMEGILEGVEAWSAPEGDAKTRVQALPQLQAELQAQREQQAQSQAKTQVRAMPALRAQPQAQPEPGPQAQVQAPQPPQAPQAPPAPQAPQPPPAPQAPAPPTNTQPEAPPHEPADDAPAPRRRRSTPGGRRPTGRRSPGRRSTGRSSRRRPSDPAGRRSQIGRRPLRRRTLFSSGERNILAAAVAVGVLVVFGTYYVTNFGVPGFAKGLQPMIELFTGKLPASGSS